MDDMEQAHPGIWWTRSECGGTSTDPFGLPVMMDHCLPDQLCAPHVGLDRRRWRHLLNRS